MKRFRFLFLLPALLGVALLAGCASLPSGPSVMALPGSGKNFDQFRRDDIDCRQYAQSQIGGVGANQAAVDAELRSAAVGTAVGAVAGAALGGREAAGVGAATGLIFGSLVGSGAGQTSASASQRNYDNAYVQCMYAKGEQVPVASSVSRYRSQTPLYPAPAATSVPPPLPPPPGLPPPPPPDISPLR